MSDTDKVYGRYVCPDCGHRSSTQIYAMEHKCKPTKKPKMKNFAKLFEFDEGQYLVYLEPDGEEYILHQIINYDSCQADMSLTFQKEETARKVFDEYEENARDRFEAFLNMVDGQFNK